MKKACAIPLGVMLALFVGICLLLWDFGRIRDWGVDTDPPDWLPSEATNVTYIDGSINRIAEFDIRRSEFQRWCESIEKPLSPVDSTQRSVVWRANPFLARIGAIEELTLQEQSSNMEIQEFLDWREVTLAKGDLFYEERWPNNGGYAIGFDTSEKRGYFAYAHH